MALPTAAAGAVKGATAKQMALFAKTMNKIDWAGVESAMVSIKDFAASASIVQETMGDIKSMGQDLTDLALGELMAKIAGKAGELFAALEPFATLIGTLTSKLDTTQLDALILNLKIFNALLENTDTVLQRLFGWLIPIIQALLGMDLTPPDTGGTPPSGGGGGGRLPRGKLPVEGF